MYFARISSFKVVVGVQLIQTPKMFPVMTSCKNLKKKYPNIALVQMVFQVPSYILIIVFRNYFFFLVFHLVFDTCIGTRLYPDSRR